LESFDIKHLAALTAPRPARFVNASTRVNSELEGLQPWYRLMGKDFAPVE
jgi:hypothetical protein